MDIFFSSAGLVLFFAGAAASGALCWLALHRKITYWKDLEQAHFQLSVTSDAQKSLYEERLKAYEEAEARLTQSFQHLSHQALQETTTSFFSMAKSTFDQFHALSQQDLTNRQGAIQQMLTPFKERLQSMDQKLSELEQARAVAYTSLHHQVRDMLTAQERLHQETATLAKALRLPGVKGRWGEVQLRRMVEMSGMVPHCHFSEQVHGEDATGHKYRPDMVIHLPGQKEVVLDSKVPIKAYLEAQDATTDEAKMLCLKAYAKHLRHHIKELSSKAYWQQFSTSPEFVILFLPADPFLSTALEVDHTLLEDAFSQNVIIATPGTLMALLQSMAFGWQQATMAEKIQEVRSVAQSLHQKFGDMIAELEKIGRYLRLSVGSFNSTVELLNDQITPMARTLGDFLGKEASALPRVESVMKQPVPLDMPTTLGSAAPAPAPEPHISQPITPTKEAAHDHPHD